MLETPTMGGFSSLRNTYNKNTYPVSMGWDSAINLGAGADADVLGTGANQNSYTAIAVGVNDLYTDNCPGNVCTVYQRNFAGISNVPYVLLNDYILQGSNDTVNIDPGVIIKFASNYGLYVRSTVIFRANGTSGNPVYFTSFSDDTIGGDTNNDGSATTPAKNNWGNINLESAAAHSFTFAGIRYGSSGIYATAGTLSVSDSNFESNTTGLYVVLGATPTLARLNFIGNTTGLRNGNSTIVSAENMWWNSTNGPNDTSAAGQCVLNSSTGDTVTDTAANPVDYCPFSTSIFNTSTLPIASSTLINGGDLTAVLTKSTTAAVTCTTTVTDADGYTDITGVVATLYRTSVGYGAVDNDNSHYSMACTGGSGSGTTRPYTCSFSVWFIADATDADSPYPTDTWTCHVVPSDNTGVGTADTDTIEMGSLLGIEVASTLNFGNLIAGTNTGATNTELSIVNSGNVAIDIEHSGVNLCIDYPTCAGSTISVGNIEYSDSPFVYSTGIDLTTSPVLSAYNIAKSTVHPSTMTRTVYWGIAIPALTTDGSYTGRADFTAVKH